MTDDPKPAPVLRRVVTAGDHRANIDDLRKWMADVEAPGESPCVGFAVTAIRGDGTAVEAYSCVEGRIGRMHLVGAVHLLLDDLIAAWRR
jgi:hypothetical protein